MTEIKRAHEKTAEIVRNAGGEIVGRTKFQKIAYLLEITGQGFGFDFEYRHYGPYSEDLARAIFDANACGLIEEEERTAQWGGRYSIFRLSNGQVTDQGGDDQRAAFVKKAATMGSIELEIAATAAYLKRVEGCPNPWDETRRRKPEKASEQRIERARQAYRELLNMDTPEPLPAIV